MSGSDDGRHNETGVVMKALVCQSGFGVVFGAVGVLVAGFVESDWVAFTLAALVALVGVCVGVLVADRRGWL